MKKNVEYFSMMRLVHYFRRRRTRAARENINGSDILELIKVSSSK